MTLYETTPALQADLPEIYLDPADHEALSRLIGNHDGVAATALLRHELDRATLCEGRDLPGDAVGLNRWVHYVDDRHVSSLRRVRLVLPWEADIDAGCISVLSHVGAGLIGLREGQAIDWPDPAGSLRRLTPVLVEDPEDLV
ncbi:GreA/GreB family elongation factor [Brevundimonas sp. Root1279]|uniref:GreA/GreB family elongation factor n=1 Tax=Brevundimonas sp. Root1279 TaxID=1736443 RepID=UPI000700FCF0|nr:GreA/GreB family elongation factor [Brevundimonas sp. Root1279]KQW82499.1 nucleoside diphosphate kinase regulator [Brevundimonas sp. Root1279]